MKVLWFTHISFKLDNNQKVSYPGGNWVTSLLKLVEHDISLRLVFWGEKDLIFKNEFGTTFQQISIRKRNRFSDIINRWNHEIDDSNQLKSLKKVIDDFDPDLIQVFGTESAFGIISNHTNKPVIIHLQGIINPCLNAWMIPGLNKYGLLKNSNLSYFIRGIGLFHDYFRFRKMADRELAIFKSCNLFLGRTNWDKQMCNLYAPDSLYYHCDEVLREKFYLTQWENPRNKKLILASTINSNIYKGLDVILKTAIILKNQTKLEFEWNIYGITEQDEYAKIVKDLIGSSFSLNFIFLKGIANEECLIDGLRKSNLFIHCSYIDNSPNSICEAQIIGLPVISSNVGGIDSIIQHGETGFLVPSNDPHLLASQIVFLADKPDLLDEVSKNSRKVAIERHNKDRIKKDLLGIYNLVVNNSNSNI